MQGSPGESMEKHGIAVTVEAILPVDGLLVGRQDALPSDERRYEKQERGAGEMEVGDQRVDTAELVAWQDVEIAFPFGLSQVRLQRHMLQDPCYGRAHGDDSPSPLPRQCHGLSGFSGKEEPLGVDP